MSEFDKEINRWGYFERKYNDDLLKDKNFNKDSYINATIADIDFKSPITIQNAIIKRAKRGTYSYGHVASETLDAIVNWYKSEKNTTLLPEWIKIVHGTVNAMHQIVNALTNVGDNILIQTPIYAPFGHSIKSNGRNIIENKLIYDSKLKKYQIDFIDFEMKISSNNIKLFMLCSPHNPGERVWSVEELIKMTEICKKYNCYVFSDEVHSDVTFVNFTSIAKLDFFDQWIIANSPNKAFNTGGLKASYLIIKNSKIKNLIENQYERQWLTSPNVLINDTFIAAFTEDGSKKWLKELGEYIYANYEFIVKELKNTKYEIMELQAMYLPYINIEKLNLSNDEFYKKTEEKNMIISSSDAFYGNSEGWFRLNIGAPRSIVKRMVEILIQIDKEST